jgi:hypothetical protein
MFTRCAFFLVSAASGTATLVGAIGEELRVTAGVGARQ